MYKIKVLTLGKTKETWLDEALEEFYKRLRGQMQIEWILAKDDAHLIQLVEKEPLYISLDPAGKTLGSEEFSAYILNCLREGGARLAFVIGGPTGLPPSLKRGAHTLSLSRLTFTHQIVRLILVEQLYRALEIEKGSPYHK